MFFNTYCYLIMIYFFFQLMTVNMDRNEWTDSFQLNNNIEEENNENNIELDVLVLAGIAACADYFLKYIYKEPC